MPPARFARRFALTRGQSRNLEAASRLELIFVESGGETIWQRRFIPGVVDV